MVPKWSTLTPEDKQAIVQRINDGADVRTIAKELEMKPGTLARRIRELRQFTQEPSSEVGIQVAQAKPLPLHEEVFAQLKKVSSISLSELSRKYDRSEQTILNLIDEMIGAGYMIDQRQERVSLPTYPQPLSPNVTPLADLLGQQLKFAVVSDLHAGSTHSQPSAFIHFVNMAYHKYGIRHILIPGDLTQGIYGYRGIEHDLIPNCQPYSRHLAYLATNAQVRQAISYIPKLEGLHYYAIGGNHDWWHVVNSGIDPLNRISEIRPDIHYLGWDVADVPLTDRVDVRLWHPSGGVPYALTYRIQKGLESIAFEELSKAIVENTNPKVRLLISGHLHIEAKFTRGPFTAAVAGAFEGQTNYLKRKGLFPQIGGSIWDLSVTDGGLLDSIDYMFKPYPEVENDYLNFPQVVQELTGAAAPTKVETLFSVKKDEEVSAA